MVIFFKSLFLLSEQMPCARGCAKQQFCLLNQFMLLISLKFRFLNLSHPYAHECVTITPR